LMEEWLWAVAAVESRAFGVMRSQVSSSSGQAYPASSRVHAASFCRLLVPAGMLHMGVSGGDCMHGLIQEYSAAPSCCSCTSPACLLHLSSNLVCLLFTQGALSAAHHDTLLSSSSSSSNDTPASAADPQPATAQQPAASSRLVGMVPVLDLANHTCRSDCHHAVDYEAGRFNLYISSSSSSSTRSTSSVSQQPSVAGNIDADCMRPGQQQVLKTYGEKDNR
jgi:hypothetical protein